MSHAHYDELRSELQKLLASAEGLLKEGAEAAGDGLDGARTQARESLERACEHLRAAGGELGTRAHRVDRTVRSHPWESIAAVGIAAFLLGFLVRRR